MKKQLMRFLNATVSTRFFRLATVVVLLTGSAAANAQVIPAAAITQTEATATADIKFVEANENNMVFAVKVDNAAGERFTITIKDNVGQVLYRASFNEVSFNKKFLLPKGESSRLTFVLKGLSQDVTQTFEVNSRTRIVEDVVVKRVI